MEKPNAAVRKLIRPLAPLPAYLLLAVAFYAPVALGLRWFPIGDFTDHFLPFSLFQRSELLAGRLPLWNPYTFSGHPFLADTQAAVFYPISNLVLALTLSWDGVMARLYFLQVEAILQVALAGFFTYLLARDLVRSRTAAFLAGCLFAFSGFLTGYPPLQLAILRTAIWLPLVLWCIRRAFLADRPWRWWIAAAAANTMAFLGGHPQTFLYLSYCVAGWAFLQLLRAPQPRAPHARRMAAFYALFLGLSAAQLLPSIEFTLLSVRADVDYAYVSGGLGLHDLWQVLAAGVVSQFSPLFVGLIGLGLALLGTGSALVTAVKTRDPQTKNSAVHALFFAAVALVGLLASFGGNGFLYPLLYKWAPGWSIFRGQERSAYLVAFGLSLLAAYGVVFLRRVSGSDRRKMAGAWAFAGAVGLVLAWVVLGPTADAAGQLALRRAAFVGALALAAGALLAVSKLDARRAVALLTVIALVELFAANVATNLAPRPVLPSAEAQALQSAVAATVTPNLAPSRAQNEGRLPEDYGMLVGVPDISGSSPLRLTRYDGFLHDFPQPRLWQLTGVGTVLTSRADLYAPTSITDETDNGTEPGFIHRVEPPYSRAWLVNSLISADDEGALPLLSDTRLDLAATAVLPSVVHGQGRPLGLEDGWLADTTGSGARLEQVHPGNLRVTVTSAAGGYLVISENWMPGWEATIIANGARRAAPVLRTNLSFLGVPVSPGELTVELRYRPLSARLGLLLSALTILLLIVAPLPASRRAIGRVRVRLTEGAFPWSRVGLLAVTLLAFALRVFRLGYQELRGDEALGRLFSMEPIATLIRSTIALKEPHPVASYVIQGAWLELAGHTEFALRFVSVFFGVLAAPLIYCLARRLDLSKLTGLIAAALLAASPYAIWHSQDARMYSISLALTLASAVLMLRGLDRGGKPVWAAYIAITWLALQTHYYAAYIVIAQNLFVFGRALVNRRERARLLPWLTAQVITGLLYLPWLWAARSTLTGYGGNGDSPGFIAMWLRSLGVFAVGETMPADQHTIAAALAAFLALLGAFRLARSGAIGRRALWLLSLYLICPLLITWVGALSRPIFNERYIIAALPGFALLAAVGITPARRPTTRLTTSLNWIGGLSGVIFAAAMLLSLCHMVADPVFSKSAGWRQLAAVMARFTASASPDTTRAAQTFPDPTLWYYYRASDGLVIPPAALDQAAADALVAELAHQGIQRVVLAVMPSANWDNNEIGPRALQTNYALSLEVPVGNWRVQVYDHAPTDIPSQNTGFANGIQLTGAAVGQERLVPGDVLTVWLRWAGNASALSGSEKITVQLLDQSGKVAAQTDRALVAGDLAQNPAGYGIALPRTLPVGQYRLLVAVYDPARQGAPRWLTTDGADHVDLGPIKSVPGRNAPFE